MTGPYSPPTSHLAKSRRRRPAKPSARGPRAFGRTGDPTQFQDAHIFPFLVFLGWVLFFYLQGGWRFPVLGAIRFELIVGAALSIYSAFRLMQVKSVATTGALGKWLIALILLCAVMTAFSHSPGVSWNTFIDKIVKYMMLTLFITALVTSPGRLRGFLFAYLLAFAKMTQEGITGLLNGSLVWQNQGTPRLHGATPNYEHPNSFAGTQLGTLPFLTYLMPIVPRLLGAAMLLQAFGVIIIVITTGSRTAYVAICCWMLLLFFQSKAKFRAIAILVAVLMAAWPLVPSDYQERFETIFTQKDKEGASIDMRKQIFEDALEIWVDNPLGVGLGAFTVVREERFDRTQPTHNLYLEVATDLGLQGVIIFLGWVSAMLIAAFRLARDFEAMLTRTKAVRSDDPRLDTRQRAQIDDLKLVRATAMGVASFLLIRLSLGFFGHDFYEIYWWFAAGLIIALQRMRPVLEARTAQIVREQPAPAGAV